MKVNKYIIVENDEYFKKEYGLSEINDKEFINFALDIILDGEHIYKIQKISLETLKNNIFFENILDNKINKIKEISENDNRIKILEQIKKDFENEKEEKNKNYLKWCEEWCDEKF